MKLTSMAFLLCATLGTLLHIYSCWLSTEKGVIWAFVAPMLAIITVSELIFSYNISQKELHWVLLQPGGYHSCLGLQIELQYKYFCFHELSGENPRTWRKCP